MARLGVFPKALLQLKKVNLLSQKGLIYPAKSAICFLFD